MYRKPRRVPLWVLAAIIVVALPVAAFPAMLASARHGGDVASSFLWLYPAYVAATAILAWQCYGRRSEMTWILLALMALTHVAMWLLVKG